MDKLKEQLAVPIAICKEHGFWFLCGTILIISLVSWYISTGKLQEQQTKYKGEIDSAVSMLKSVRDTPNHPNESTNKGMDQIMQRFGEDVYVAWTQLAESQKAVLVWNAGFIDDKFLAEVRKLQPIETTVADDHDESINRDNRRLYRDYIDEEIPKLADIILAKWQVDASKLGGGGMPGMAGDSGGAAGAPSGAGGSGMPGMAGMAGGMPGMGGGLAAKDDDPSVVVIWNPANQKEITISHFGMATISDIPSTLDVLYAQEDLWVFQNLLGIVKATNEGATRKHEAAIKYVDYVRIGSSAGGVGGQITRAGSSSSSGNDSMMGTMQGGGGAGMAGGPGMPSGGGAGGAAGMMMKGGGASAAGAGGAAGAPAGAGGAMPAGQGAAGSPNATAATTAGSDRYVDLSYASIKDISRLRSAMKGQFAKPEDMLLAVAKRMPVRMQFKMDQRKLTTLLAECGNSQLPVEVRQVRINRGTATALGGGMMGGGMMGGGMSGGMTGPPGGSGGGIMSGMPSGAGAGMGSPAGGEGGAAGAFGGGGGMLGMGAGGAGARPASSIASSKEDPNEIQVEIYGIVYIYNPPERELLGLTDPVAPAAPAVPVAPVTPTSATPEKTNPPINAGAATGR